MPYKNDDKQKRYMKNYMREYMKELRQREREILREARERLGMSTKIRKRRKKGKRK